MNKSVQQQQQNNFLLLFFNRLLKLIENERERVFVANWELLRDLKSICIYLQSFRINRFCCLI